MLNFYRKNILKIHLVILFLAPLILTLIEYHASFDIEYYLLLLIIFSLPAVATITELILTLNAYIKFKIEIKNVGIGIFDGLMIFFANCLYILTAYILGRPYDFLMTLPIENLNRKELAFLDFFYYRKELIIVFIVMLIFLIFTVILDIKTNLSRTAKKIFKSILIFITILIIVYSYISFFAINISDYFFNENLIYIFPVLVPFNMILICARMIRER